MARADKVTAVADVREHLSSSAATLLTNYRGLSVTQLATLRTELRKSNATYKVTKNTLTRIAAREAGIDGLDDLLTGPTALVFCHEDPVGPAKALKAFAKDHPALEVKGGYLDGAVLDAIDALKLAELATRDELLAQMAGLLYGALANTARLLNALPTKQAQLIQALIEAGGAPGAPTDVPAADVSTAEDDVPADETLAEDEAPAADMPADDAPSADVPTDDVPADDAEPEA